MLLAGVEFLCTRFCAGLANAVGFSVLMCSSITIMGGGNSGWSLIRSTHDLSIGSGLTTCLASTFGACSCLVNAL